jgi:hypothetical protein
MRVFSEMTPAALAQAVSGFRKTYAADWEGWLNTPSSHRVEEFASILRQCRANYPTIPLANSSTSCYHEPQPPQPSSYSRPHPPRPDSIRDAMQKKLPEFDPLPASTNNGPTKPFDPTAAGQTRARVSPACDSCGTPTAPGETYYQEGKGSFLGTLRGRRLCTPCYADLAGANTSESLR